MKTTRIYTKIIVMLLYGFSDFKPLLFFFVLFGFFSNSIKNINSLY